MMPKVSGKEPIHMIYSPHIVARVTLIVRGIFYSMLRAILLHLLLRFTSTGTSWGRKPEQLYGRSRQQSGVDR